MPAEVTVSSTNIAHSSNISYNANIYDLVIIGAGAAGISIVLALIHNHPDYKGNILLLEQGESFDAAKTWSFWQTKDVPDYVRSVIPYKWHSWSMSRNTKQYVFESAEHPYCSLPASHFFEYAQAIISEHENIELQFQSSVQRMEQSEQQVHIVCSGSDIYAANVIDTRPPNLKSSTNGLFQSFFGLEIEFESEHGLGNKVELMSDLSASERGVEFLYVLPLANNKLLVEFTGFYTAFTEPFSLEPYAKNYVENRFGKLKKRTVRKESACLPMFNIHPVGDSERVIHGGVAGGAMRAATGYSFLSIQRWAKHVASDFVSTGALVQCDPISWHLRQMDEVFLRVLNKHPSLGDELLEKFAQGLNANQYARFMSENSTFLDLLAVIRTMPKTMFFMAMIDVMKTKR